jgi:hypothetical protein
MVFLHIPQFPQTLNSAVLADGGVETPLQAAKNIREIKTENSLILMAF